MKTNKNFLNYPAISTLQKYYVTKNGAPTDSPKTPSEARR